MIEQLNNCQEYVNLKGNIILEGFRGSQAHGTYVPQNKDSFDDIDLMTVIVPKPENYIGLKEFKTKEIKFEKYDIVVYDIKKYIRLLLKQNPNVIGLLWLREMDYTYRTKWGNKLIEARDIFNSKKAYQSFTGYAYSQLKRMTHFQEYNGYMGKKRKELVDRFGYDVKNASHLIRLLKMGIEYMSTGKLNVFRHDNAMLIDIKQGKWALQKVQNYADELFSLADRTFVESKLPNEPDYEIANVLCMEIVKDFIRDN